MGQFAVRVLIVLFHLHILYPSAASGGHIVGLPSHYYSHCSAMRKLGKELASRGHQYTQLVPHFLADNFKDVNIEAFKTSLTSEAADEFAIQLANAGDTTSLRGMYKMSQWMGVAVMQAMQLCKDLLEDQSIMNKLEGNTNVVLCDLANFCCFILADKLNATRVDFSSLGFGGAGMARYLGIPQFSVHFTQETIADPSDSSKFSFTRRLKSFFLQGLITYIMISTIPENLWQKHGKPNSQHKNAIEAWRAHNLVLIGHDFALEYPRPMGPHIKMIGAVLPEQPRELPQDLSNFMSNNKNVILVSFGTALPSDFNQKLLQTIADGLGQLSLAVLWKLSENTSITIAPNIKIVSWFPQNDILGHSSTKLFVTHCGLNSFLESIYHKIPIVAIPLLFDQYRQATIVQLKGLGITLDKNTLRAEDLTQAINKVLQEKQYRENVRRISALMQDRRRTPAQEGADWIEYALNHNGAKHLVSEAMDLPEYQLHLFDVFLFLLVLVAVTVFILIKICKHICQRKMSNGSFSKEKQS